MSIIIGQSSGRVILDDPNQQVRIGYSSGSVVGPEDYEARQKEEAIINQSFDPNKEVQPLNPHMANFEEIKNWIRTCEDKHLDESNGDVGLEVPIASPQHGKSSNCEKYRRTIP